jgi:hypothetical protein
MPPHIWTIPSQNGFSAALRATQAFLHQLTCTIRKAKQQSYNGREPGGIDPHQT